MDKMTLHDLIRDWKIISGALATTIASIIGLASITAKVLPAGWRLTKFLTWLSVNGSKAEQEVKAVQQAAQSTTSTTPKIVPPAAVLLLCLLPVVASAQRLKLHHHINDPPATGTVKPKPKPPPKPAHPKKKDTAHGS